MKKLVELLADPLPEGYPAEYLLARLPVRRNRFAERCNKTRGNEAWLELQKEHHWLFRRMNHKLRENLAPVFFYFELPNLFTALRFRAGEDRINLREVLKESLLNPKLKSILAGEQSFPAMLKELGALLGRYGEGFAGLAEAWQNGGHTHLEIAILRGFTRIIAREKPLLLVGDFLDRLLERRNILALAKEKRWQLNDYPIATGYSFPTRRLLLHQLDRLESKAPAIAGNPAKLDILLQHRIEQRLRNNAFEGEAPEKIIDYLFFCRLTAGDCGIKGLTGLLGGPRVKEELIS